MTQYVYAMCVGTIQNVFPHVKHAVTLYASVCIVLIVRVM